MAITTTYEAPSGDATTVKVTFTSTNPDVVHKRDVNAVFTSGSYDATKTAARVADVALGVANKIAVGAIAAPVESEESGE